MQTKEKTKTMGEPKEFFFPGGLEYEPTTIEAETLEEATAKWEEEKQKVELSITNTEQTIWQKESEDSSKSD